MVFSSAIFLFIFLPLVFILYRVIPGLKAKNILLMVFSLVFYAFGNLSFLPLLLVSVLVNYLAGILVSGTGKGRKAALILAVLVNLGLLCVFKYLDFIIGNLNLIPGVSLQMTGIVLPIGISFFTFQGMSYVIDVYREPALGTRNLGKVLLYISFFPQLVAGPIVKYGDIAAQIDDRTCTPQATAEGIRRFIFGLSKKMLIANTVGAAADAVYAMNGGQLDLRLAWLGAVCYTLQIYYDFSGYSDMAIGMGKMFGFTFKENFLHPYGSDSIKVFWRRWHISLSSWFRDYLYIPLGGNRKGEWRARLNRIIVFFCTGLWHGANWTFVLWGLWHGAFLMLEDLLPKNRKKIPVVGHIYTLLVVILGFVLFRADSLSQAGMIIAKMFTGFTFTAESSALLANLLAPSLIAVLVIAVIFMFPVGEALQARVGEKGRALLYNAALPATLLLLALDIISLAASAFNPFIYFQF